MSEITILNNMAERAVDHWVPGDLYKVNQTWPVGLEHTITSGNCLLGLVGYAVWGDSYNMFCEDHGARGPLKNFLKNHKLKADCLDGYDVLEQDPDALAVIHRLAKMIRAQGSLVDENGNEWNFAGGYAVDAEVVYGYNDALGKDKVIELIDKARADVGALGAQ
jgi:hypothetical protein